MEYYEVRLEELSQRITLLDTYNYDVYELALEKYKELYRTYDSNYIIKLTKKIMNENVQWPIYMTVGEIV